MHIYRLGDLMRMLVALTQAARDLDTADVLERDISTPPFKETLAVVLDGIFTMCNGIELDSSLIEQITELEKSLKEGAGDYRPAVLKTQCRAIIDGLQNNLDSKLFMFMPRDRGQYYYNREIWNHAEVFPRECQFDMSEAGNCYAAGRDTATVFHLMRVAEHGLRLLGKKLRVRVTHSGKAYPMEFADWEKVIVAIKAKLDDARHIPAGPKRQAALEFYSDAADHCTFMKDIWRNNISHTRRPYTQAEALVVFGRVRDLMKFLSGVVG